MRREGVLRRTERLIQSQGQFGSKAHRLVLYENVMSLCYILRLDDVFIVDCILLIGLLRVVSIQDHNNSQTAWIVLPTNHVPHVASLSAQRMALMENNDL